MTTNGRIQTLVVSQPGARQEALCAFLASIPGIVVLGSMSGLDFKLSRIGDYDPALVVVDHNFERDRSLEAVTLVKTSYPSIQCVVFVATAHQRELALAAGADEVLLKRDLPNTFAHYLTRLTLPPGGSGAP